MKRNIKTHLNRSLASAKELYVTTNSKCRIRFILKIIMKSVPYNGSGQVDGRVALQFYTQVPNWLHISAKIDPQSQSASVTTI